MKQLTEQHAGPSSPIFVYDHGTLEWLELHDIRRALFGDDDAFMHTPEQWMLKDYRAEPLEGWTVKALIPSPGEAVIGELLIPKQPLLTAARLDAISITLGCNSHTLEVEVESEFVIRKAWAVSPGTEQRSEPSIDELMDNALDQFEFAVEPTGGPFPSFRNGRGSASIIFNPISRGMTEGD